MVEFGAFVVAQISVRSPGQLFIFISENKGYRMKELSRTVDLILKKEALVEFL